MKWMTLSLILFLAVIRPGPGEGSNYAKVDELFAGRDDLFNLQKAEALLASRRKEFPPEYETLWRVGRIYYYLGEAQKDANGKLKYFEEGQIASRLAVGAKPDRPEGHFWLAANLGEASELRGIWSSLRWLSTIRMEFEKAFEIDSSVESGKAYLALGEMKLRLPGFLGGDDKKGIQLLEKGLHLFPGNHEIKLALSLAYSQKGRKAEARELLQQILGSTDPAMTPRELTEARTQAQKRLHNLN
jgi:tetratricopeptide (TPR) repeat protein